MGLNRNKKSFYYLNTLELRNVCLGTLSGQEAFKQIGCLKKVINSDSPILQNYNLTTFAKLALQFSCRSPCYLQFVWWNCGAQQTRPKIYRYSGIQCCGQREFAVGHTDPQGDKFGQKGLKLESLHFVPF